MRTFALIVALIATEAGAQEGYFGPDFGDVIGGIAVVGAVYDGLIGAAGIAAGTGTMVQLARGGNAKPWWIASLGLAGGNAALSVLWTAIAANNFWDEGFIGIALAHAGVAIYDLAMGLIGAAHRPPVEPTIVGGRDAGGRPWTGLGVRLVSF